MPLQDLFTRHAHTLDFQNVKLVNNSSEEIEEVVREFIEAHEDNRPYGVHLSEIIPDIPDNIWTSHPTVRISPVWLKKYELENTVSS